MMTTAFNVHVHGKTKQATKLSGGNESDTTTRASRQYPSKMAPLPHPALTWQPLPLILQ
jgi:hypothetical protein